MKKILFLTFILLSALISHADYTGTVTTSQSELTFSTNNGYNVASFRDKKYTGKVRAPQMPVKTLSFLIPIDQMVSSIVINSTTVQQLVGSYTICPVQTPVTTTLAAPPPPFDDPDPAIYNSTNPYPGITYSATNDGYPMGYHVVTINFYPLQFVPANHILNLYTSINFTIVYASNTVAVLRPNRQSVYSNNLSKTYIKSIVANPNNLGVVTGGAKQVVSNTTASSSSTQNIRGMSPASLNSIPDYIIIAPASLSPSFQPLADWKTQKGINTLIVKTGDIYNNYPGCDNAEKIRNYLKDAYLNFGSSYVLLGGDINDKGDINDQSGTELVPTRIAFVREEVLSDGSRITEIKATDYYFSTVQGNWNGNGNAVFGEDGTSSVLVTGGVPNDDKADYSPVFFVGRAPVHTTAEADRFVNKIIHYENLKNAANQPLSNTNYIKNFSFLDGLRNGSSIDGLDNATGVINPSLGYHVLKLYDPARSPFPVLNNTSAMNSLNTGWANFGQSYGMNHIFYHMDHSGPVVCLQVLTMEGVELRVRIWTP